MRERRKGRTQEQAAASANLRSRKTVARYERIGQLPSEIRKAREYRTRPDAFVEDWPQVEEMLERAPTLEAKALFEWLCEQRPGKYREGQLRTFQRRVSRWKAENEEKVAVLAQEHRPGEAIQTDGTDLSKLGVTIQGQPLEATLIHSVLPYSNWEWGRVTQSETLAAIRLGVESTLKRLGHVPEYHQTDNSSAATYWPGAKGEGEAKREYTEGYLLLLEYYGMKARTTHISSPHENGDVESSNGGLKRALEQHLLLRGRREFENVEAFEAFIFQVMARRNDLREERVREELEHMRALTQARLGNDQEERVKVSPGSLIRVERNTYSVPTSLIGKWVKVRILEWYLEVRYQGKLMETVPRLRGEHRSQINYRHLVNSLLRKPGGFRNYRYREDLFPSLLFRRAWETLNGWQSPRKADLAYLRILKLAARTLETDVATALELLLETKERWDDTDVEQLVAPKPIPIPDLSCGSVELQAYDRLLSEVTHDA